MAKRRRATKPATEEPVLDNLTEEVVDEILNAPVIEVEEELIPEAKQFLDSIVEKPVVEEKPVAKPKVAPAPAEKRRAGMYYKGKRITAVPAKLGKKWTIVVDGKRLKVLKSEIETVK